MNNKSIRFLMPQKNLGRVPAPLILLLLLVATAGARANPPFLQTSGEIAGRVTRGNQPMAGMTVIAYSASERLTGPAQQALTGADGGYHITGLSPGSYIVAPVAPAYWFPEESGRFWVPGKTITLNEGETVGGIDFSLKRGGVITGRITDAEGRPLIAIRPLLRRADNEARFVPVTSIYFTMGATDDRGIYRYYGLEPGRYVISAAPPARGADHAVPRSVYYPGVSDVRQAKAIEVGEGDELSGIDIVVRPDDVTAAYVASGKIVDSVTSLPAGGMSYKFGYVMEDRLGGQSLMAPPGPAHTTDASGSFRIEGLRNGKYAVFAETGGSDSYSETTKFEIADSDVEGLVIQLHPGITMTGVASIQGVATLETVAAFRNLSVIAEVEDEGASAPSSAASKIEQDGSFRLTGLRPGKVRFAFYAGAGMKGIVLRGVERDGADATAGLDISPGQRVSGVHLVFIYATGVIRGEVQIVGGSLPPGVTVYVIPEWKGEGKVIGVQGARADARGHFELEGLPGGEYELLVRLIPARPGVRPPQLAPVTQRVKVVEGSQTDVTIVVDLSKTSAQEGRP